MKLLRRTLYATAFLMLMYAIGYWQLFRQKHIYTLAGTGHTRATTTTGEARYQLAMVIATLYRPVINYDSNRRLNKLLQPCLGDWQAADGSRLTVQADATGRLQYVSPHPPHNMFDFPLHLNPEDDFTLFRSYLPHGNGVFDAELLSIPPARGTSQGALLLRNQRGRYSFLPAAGLTFHRVE